MMKRFAAAAAALLALTACGSGVNVRTQSAPNFSPDGRSTFRILPMPRPADGATLGANDPMLSNSITNQALRNDVIAALESRGYRRADGGAADLDVAMYASATHALDIHTWDYGYSWRMWPREYTQVTPYERGTVIIDLVDPSNHELLWRGQGVASVSENPNHYVDELGKVVTQIAKKLPAATTHRAN
ncbi:MAG TPA: DUF4136 domain-containing protein [Gemmatimonadaceae bacterium]|jgi:hypothetical protein|nr:DUF4136 domain-containing protein [Gemmatimonadaceae bacterium]